MTKPIYEAPELSLVGKLEEVTRGQSTGARLDSSFPTNTPSANLTFS